MPKCYGGKKLLKKKKKSTKAKAVSEKIPKQLIMQVVRFFKYSFSLKGLKISKPEFLDIRSSGNYGTAVETFNWSFKKGNKLPLQVKLA